MDPELVTIRPSDIKFVFELKQQSSCSVQLINNSEEYVAFKVKTTSPKKYSVRPNTGIILPNSSCEFSVTMQAQNTVPPEMQCKDKFLIQSMVVPFGSTEKDISSGIFTKGSGRYIQENKMRVLLVSPQHSPSLLPINGALKPETTAHEALVFQGFLKQEPAHPELISVKGNMKQEPEVDESPVLNENMNEEQSVSFSPTHQQNDVFTVKSSPLLSEDSEELRSKASNLERKLRNLEHKLYETDKIILKLGDEKGAAVRERDLMRRELATFKSKAEVKVQAGFPPLFVCFVALVGMYLGFLLSS